MHIATAWLDLEKLAHMLQLFSFSLKHILQLMVNFAHNEAPFQFIQKDKSYKLLKELDMSSVKSQKKKLTRRCYNKPLLRICNCASF